MGQSFFVSSLGRLGNLLAKDFSFNAFIKLVCLAVSASWSRAWFSNQLAKISFKSAAREEEDVTALDASLAGMEGVCKMMEASVALSGVVAFKEDDEDDGYDKDGLKAAAAMCLGATGRAKEGMVMFDMGTEGGLMDDML